MGRVGRRRKSARERRAQALHSEARRFRRHGCGHGSQARPVSGRCGLRRQLRCGVLVPQGQVSAVLLPCSALRSRSSSPCCAEF